MKAKEFETKLKSMSNRDEIVFTDEITNEKLTIERRMGLFLMRIGIGNYHIHSIYADAVKENPYVDEGVILFNDGNEIGRMDVYRFKQKVYE